MVTQSFLIISGTVPTRGMTVLYLNDESRIRSELGDWVIDENDNRSQFNLAVNKEYYSLEFIKDHIAFTKYRTVYDGVGRRGYFSITIAIPNQYYIPWNVLEILDETTSRFVEINLVNNIIKKNVSGLKEIEEIFNNQVKSNTTKLKKWPDSSQYEQYGFLIYRKDEIQDYLQDPWRKQYKGYKRIYFFDESLRSLVPSSDIFTEIKNLYPRDNRFKLKVKVVNEDGKSVKGVTIKINGKENDTVEEIRDSEEIEIEVSRDFYVDYNIARTAIKDLVEDKNLKIKKVSRPNEIGGLELTVTLNPKKYEYRIILVALDDKPLKGRSISIDDYRPKTIEGDNTTYIFEDLKFHQNTATLVIQGDTKYKGVEKTVKIDPDVLKQETEIILQLKPTTTENGKDKTENKEDHEGNNKRKIKIKNIIIYILSALVIITLSFLAYIWPKDDLETTKSKEETGINEAVDIATEDNTTLDVEIDEKLIEDIAEEVIIDSIQAELDKILAFVNEDIFDRNELQQYSQNFTGLIGELGRNPRDSLNYWSENFKGDTILVDIDYVNDRFENLMRIADLIKIIELGKQNKGFEFKEDMLGAFKEMKTIKKDAKLSKKQNVALSKIISKY